MGWDGVGCGGNVHLHLHPYLMLHNKEFWHALVHIPDATLHVVWCIVMCCIVVWCIVMCCIVVWCIVMWCIVMRCSEMWWVVMWCTVVLCIVMWCIVVWCIVMWRIVVWCIVMCCIVMLCIVMWCIVVWCIVVSDVLLCDDIWCIVMLYCYCITFYRRKIASQLPLWNVVLAKQHLFPCMIKSILDSECHDIRPELMYSFQNRECYKSVRGDATQCLWGHPAQAWLYSFMLVISYVSCRQNMLLPTCCISRPQLTPTNATNATNAPSHALHWQALGCKGCRNFRLGLPN